MSGQKRFWLADVAADLCNTTVSALASKEFWVTAGIAGVFLVFAFAGMSHIIDLEKLKPSCQKISDVEALAVMATGFVFCLSAILSVGQAIEYLDRKYRKWPHRKAFFAVVAIVSGMVVFGVVGYLMLSFWCR